MNPVMNEAWSIGYTQNVVTFLVFAFGIPVVIYQCASEPVQRVFRRRFRRFVWVVLIGMVLLQGLFVLDFIFRLHPCNGDVMCHSQSLEASAIMVASLVLTIGVWIATIALVSRSGLTAFLTSQILRRFARSKVVSEEELGEIIYLGENSEGGYEKSLILEAVDQIATVIQNHWKYDGRDLEYLLRNFDHIILEGEKKGSRDNFEDGRGILMSIIEGHPSDCENQFDRSLAIHVLKRIGIAAMERGYDAVAGAILADIEESPFAILEIGIKALENRSYLVAMEALNRLHGLVLDSMPLRSSEEETQAFLGLLAHFWCHGSSARKQAKKALASEDLKQDERLFQSVEEVIEIQIRNARYDTADCLSAMLNEMRKSSGPKIPVQSLD